MSQYDEIQVSEWLRGGIAAAKDGRRDEARALLMRVVEVNEGSEQAWLWLSGVVDADEDRLVCLENVLTLNPDNVQARAGLKWLEERKRRLDIGDSSPRSEADGGSSPRSEADGGWSAGRGAQGWEEGEGQDEGVSGVSAPRSLGEQEAELVLSLDGCAYCGLVVGGDDWHCPHCGGQLSSMQFKREKLSKTARLLPFFWIVLAAVNLIEFFLIGSLWGRVDGNALGGLPREYHALISGPVVTGASDVDALFEADQWVQIVRSTLVGLAVLEGLAVLGLLARLSRVHTLALALVALQLAITITLFALGFTGYFSLIFQGIFTIALGAFLFQTMDDFSKEERREWLELDRFAVSDVDFYARGNAYAKRGMWAKALLHWERAVVFNSERAKDVYFAAIARACARLGYYEKALRQMDEAIHISRAPQEWQPLREAIVEAQHRAAERDAKGSS